MDPAPELIARRPTGLPPPGDPPLPHNGVVWVESISPADGELGVLANRNVVIELSCLGQIDDDLVGVTVNGEGMTVADNDLGSDPRSMIRSNVVLVDRRAVTYTTLGDWYTGEGSVSVAVSYHGWALDGATWTPTQPETFEAGGDAWWEAWATDPNDRSAGDIHWEVVQHWYGTTYDIQFLVDELARHVGADATWICGQRYVDRFVGSGLSGALELIRWTASGLVEGWRLDRARGSGVVQGWKLLRSRGSGVIAVQFLYRHQASALVGVETLRRIAASGVVYGVNRNNVLEVQVLDASTYDALVALGVTWS